MSVNSCVSVQISDQLKKCSSQIKFMLIEVVKNIWILKDDAFLSTVFEDFLHQCSDLRTIKERKFINKSYVNRSSQDFLSVWWQCFEHSVCKFLCQCSDFRSTEKISSSVISVTFKVKKMSVVHINSDNVKQICFMHNL